VASVTKGLPLVAVPMISHGLRLRFGERATSKVAAPDGVGPRNNAARVHVKRVRDLVGDSVSRLTRDIDCRSRRSAPALLDRPRRWCRRNRRPTPRIRSAERTRTESSPRCRDRLRRGRDRRRRFRWGMRSTAPPCSTSGIPPQTIISVPVQTALWAPRAGGTFVPVEVGVQLSDSGL
jgi:hypothetical protein